MSVHYPGHYVVYGHRAMLIASFSDWVSEDTGMWYAVDTREDGKIDSIDPLKRPLL